MPEGYERTRETIILSGMSISELYTKMKTRKPLQRRTELKRKPFPKGRGFRQPDPTSAQVKRRKEELAHRRKLKLELLAECPRDGDIILCPRCLKRPDFRGLQLVHIKSMGSGGKTTRDNCGILCAPCHFGFGPGGHRTEGRIK